ncbi:MAG TPA: hypothetical protein VKM55_23340 [Candidatus Lokiarchaeia archaeon]|nr:hypothetical protein [Candidatus Lokiarchaeia archaeon]
MPKEPARWGIVKRLAIRATFDVLPTLSRRELAALFHASTTQVQQATSHAVAEWRARLAVARGSAGPPSPVRPVSRPDRAGVRQAYSGAKPNEQRSTQGPTDDKPDPEKFDLLQPKINDKATDQPILTAIDDPAREKVINKAIDDPANE